MASIGGDQALLFGGLAVSGSAFLGDTWVYDLSDNTWTEMAPAASPPARWGHALAYLGGDQVLLFGGSPDGSNFLGDTWVYDLSANTWTQKSPASAPSWRYHHALAGFGDGTVLLFGGYYGTYSDETWVYDLRGNTWTELEPKAAPPARTQHALAAMIDGQALLFGGWDGATYLGDTWVYDLIANTWQNQAPIASPSARAKPAMVAIGGLLQGSDRVLLFGGSDGTYLADTWVYDAGTNRWTDRAPDAPIPAARSYHAVATVGSGSVLLFGGVGGAGTLGDTWRYTVTANTWTDQSPPVPPARYWHAMAPTDADGALVFGGVDSSHELLGDTWAYHQGTGYWTDQAPTLAPSGRYGQAMASLGGDQVLLFGGTEDGTGWFGDTWIYDLSDNTWTAMGPASAPSARYIHGMASVGEGKVLLFGGTSSMGYMSDTWVYDVISNTWTLQSPTAHPSARIQPAMASLGGDQVLLFGGHDGVPDAETWVYDLSEDTWTNVTPAASPVGRYDHALASFGTGRALLFGGYDFYNYRDDTWLYDLQSHTWSLDDPAIAPSARFRHTMVSVGEGQAILFGGWAVDVGTNAETWLAAGFEPPPFSVYLPLVVR
jgi:N-acetylneuraminic acid mutarotase